MHRFRYMRCLHVLTASEVGATASDFEDTVVGAGREGETRNGLREQGGAGSIGEAVFVDLGRAEPGVGFALAGELKIACVDDARTDCGACFTFAPTLQFGIGK